nr:single-stranded DNA-binding protein [Enterococcus faecalis]
MILKRSDLVLVGRLTKDLDLRYTASGSAVGSFTLAVNRNFTNQNGEREADFINCVIWRKPAETMANYTRNLLENLSAVLEADNTALKQANEKLAAKAESLAQINSKTMLTSLQNSKEIDAIKEQIGGAK